MGVTVVRKLRKFLRILLIILPFSILGFSYADDINGNSNYSFPGVAGLYDDALDGVKNVYEWLLYGSEYKSIEADYNAGRMSDAGRENFEKFSDFVNHMVTYGTIDEIPGEEFSSNTWQIPYEFRITAQYSYSYVGYNDIYWTTYANLSPVDPTLSYSVSNTDPWGTAWLLSYQNGKITYNFDFSNLDSGIKYEGDIRIQVYVYFNGYPGIIRAVSPSPVGTFLTSGLNCYITDGNTINIEDGRIMFYAHVGNNSYVQLYWSDYVINYVPPYEVPTFQYPSETNNNYYDKEVNEYNYYQTAVNKVYDAGRAENFTFDVDWGLLNLPAGVALGVLSSLGDYTPVCSFNVQSMTFDIFGNNLTIPAMNFSFNADDYTWLLPFRYIISIFILLGLAKAFWHIISYMVNGGSDNVE